MTDASRRVFSLLATAVVTLWGCASSAGLPATTGASTSGHADRGAACTAVRAEPPVSPGYANTTWPNDRGDAWRTGAVAAGLPATLRGSLHTMTATLPPAPTLGSVGLDGNLYVLGGAPFAQTIFTDMILGAPRSLIPKLALQSLRYSRTVTPYVARVEPSTMHVTTLNLTQGANYAVNYPGSILQHSNGYLYVLAEGYLYKIDVQAMTVVLAKQLPLAKDSSGKTNRLTAYNGMGADMSGDLIVHGFPAVGSGNNILLMIDPSSLSIITELDESDVSIARPTIVSTNGRAPEYLYMPGSTDSKRYTLTSNRFSLDTTFSRPYLFPSDTGAVPAGADIFMGRGIVFVDNGDFTATAPMTIFAQGASAASQIQAQAAFPGSTGAGWYLFGQAGDPFKSGIEAIHNSVTGHVAGYAACNGGASVRLLWTNGTIQGSAGMAIDYASGRLYADDHQCAGISWRTKTCRLSFVVLDIRTGKEVARTGVAGSVPSNAQMFVGPGNAVYYISGESGKTNGYLTRITAP